MNGKIYFGSVKTLTTQYGEMLSIGFSAKDIAKMQECINPNGFVNLTMAKRQNIGKNGETHSIWLNTFQTAKKENDSAF